MPFVQDSATAVLACGALAVFALLVTVFVRHPAVGLGLLMAGHLAFILGDLNDFGTPSLHVGGLNLSVTDFLVMPAAVAVAVNLLRHPRMRSSLPRGVLWLLCAVVLGSLLVGAAAHGLEAAGNDARMPFLHVLVAALYVVTVHTGRDLTDVVVRIWTTVAFVYVLNAVAWWSEFGFGSSSAEVLVGGHLVGSRGLPAVAAFIIAQAAVMLLVVRRARPRTTLVTCALLLAVLLLQQRTVWIAAAAMLGCWLLLRPGRVMHKTITGVAVILSATAAGFVAAAMRGDRLTTDLAESASDDSTWEWRVSGWRQLIGGLHGMGDWLFGLPFGSGYDRFVDGVITGVNPHSYYVLMLLRVGLLGLALMSVIIIASLRAYDRKTSVGLLMWLLAAGELVYSLTYEPALPDGLLLGLMVRYAAQSRTGPPLPVPRTRTAPPVSTGSGPTTHHTAAE